jgi:uncharacterized protein (TIGR02452 family)
MDEFENTRRITKKYEIKLPKVYNSDINYDTNDVQKAGGTRIFVENMDCIDATERLENDALIQNIGLLNFASDWVIGGGVKRGSRGSRAQEEDICRKTGLYDSLELIKHHYPLVVDTVIYSENVPVLKDSTFAKLRKPYFINVISCAAMRHPKVKNKMYLYESDKEIMMKKIRDILQVAKVNGIDGLVLGGKIIKFLLIIDKI